MSSDRKGVKLTKQKTASGPDLKSKRVADAKEGIEGRTTSESEVDAAEDISSRDPGPSELVFANPHSSTRSGRPSLLESSKPTSDSVMFYSARESAVIKGSRQSQFSVVLGQMEATRNLVSGRFSQAVADEVAATAGGGGAGGSRSRGQHSTQSLRYPDVGRLSLDAFMSDSDIEDLSELPPAATATAKEKLVGKTGKKKKKKK